MHFKHKKCMKYSISQPKSSDLFISITWRIQCVRMITVYTENKYFWKWKVAENYITFGLIFGCPRSLQTHQGFFLKPSTELAYVSTSFLVMLNVDFMLMLQFRNSLFSTNGVMNGFLSAAWNISEQRYHYRWCNFSIDEISSFARSRWREYKDNWL